MNKTKICEQCGEEFEKGVNRSYKSWDNAKFCSRECYYKSLEGKKASKKTREKMSKSQGGNGKVNKRKSFKICKLCGEKFKKHPQNTYQGFDNRKFCSMKCAAKYNGGNKEKTYLTCENCGEKFYSGHLDSRFCSQKCYWKFLKKHPENHPAWKGGKSKEYERFRNTEEHKKWRKEVFERDNYTCQICGFRSGNGEHRDLHPHHLVSATKYPEFRLVIDNGLTVCRSCHGEIHSINFKDKYNS